MAKSMPQAAAPLQSQNQSARQAAFPNPERAAAPVHKSLPAMI